MRLLESGDRDMSSLPVFNSFFPFSVLLPDDLSILQPLIGET
jgi:hypothetical protein